jgi:hypothetical protein
MIESALFSGGNRRQGRYFPLSFYPVISGANTQLHATGEVIREVKAQPGRYPYELRPAGVYTGEEQVIPFPYIYIRITGNRHHGADQVFLTESQLVRLGADFSLPPEVVERSFFDFQGSLRGNRVGVAPLWHYLLNPEWRDNFLRWVKNPAPPDPAGLPWQTMPGYLPFPALVPMAHFAYEKGIVPGQMDFQSVAGKAFGLFQSGLGVHSYLLGLDGVRYVVGDQVGRSDFDKKTFAEMLGEKPARTEYSFFKRASEGEKVRFPDELLALAQLASHQFLIKGELYYFRLVRRDHDPYLYLFCHQDESTPRPLAWARLRLTEDGQLPDQTRMIGKKPDESMPEFGIMNAEVSQHEHVWQPG